MSVKGRIAAVLAAALVSAGLMTPAPAHAAVSRAQLALRWAPIHYQDVDATGSHALGGRSDYLTKVDFDGDLNGRNNWDNAGQPGASFAAHVYYSVVETGSHWYLTYFFFHPRDWIDHPFFETEHENDGEGSPWRSRRTAPTTACCAGPSRSRTPTSTRTCRPAAAGRTGARRSTGRCRRSPRRTTRSRTR
ncbi:hypothetical protein Asp14428_02370 [Actinoplanes sp. NBRC 14428]|nr:hypothetical protein Asp14428_02370 [Actinoplanes sp. NBRC 14428]